jgi:poly-gamma-glutamate synthesis protein (capsule biosynthesis protein)
MKTLVTRIAVLLLLLTACQPQATPVPSATPPPPPTATATPPIPPSLWIAPSVPDLLRQQAASWDIPIVEDGAAASLHLEPADPSTGEGGSVWTYALVAPFPTVEDDISLDELRAMWAGSDSGAFAGRPLLMTESTRAAFVTLWGEPGASVEVLPADQLLDTAWARLPALAIVPFEALAPRWKVLTVDGQAPIRKDFDSAAYPLQIKFALVQTQPADVDLAALSLPALNRDPEKMTTVIMTGVTALVRATARTMEVKGVTYPGRDIRDTMREADIAHISNEIPFYTGCDYPNPSRTKLVFCSDPRYIDLITDMGADVIELTGNHFGDYGAKATLETLAIYKEKGLPYFGGGADLADSLKPALLENHGNKIAFIGCNRPDVGSFPTATDSRPGAAPCDFDYLPAKISELRDQGYVVIATFQWNESYDPRPHPAQKHDFRLLAEAGASVVSGSQAHLSQTMEFDGDSFLHYGLGNLFFDQMDFPCAGKCRREFMDRYVIYEGRVISAELLTNMLEDYSRPRPMTPEERTAFLTEYFVKSGWIPAYPSPAPQPTVTLTPLSLPEPVFTPTPTP